MRSPWKVASELVFRRNTESSAETSDPESKHSVAETATPVVLSPHSNSEILVSSDEVSVSSDAPATLKEPERKELGNGPSIIGNDAASASADVVASERLPLATAIPRRSRRIKARDGSQYKAKRNRDDIGESFAAEIPPSKDSFPKDAAVLDSEIKDLRAKLSERLTVQNAQLMALLKRYDR